MDELLAAIQTQLRRPATLEPDTPLLSTGLVDSFGFAALLIELETRLGVRIDPAEAGADNFDTPRQMHALISAHAAGPAR